MNVFTPALSVIKRLRNRELAETSPSQVQQICTRDVYRYALRRLNSIEDAEDVAAEVYAVALIALWKPECDLRPWLIGIARRKVIDRLRKRTRRQESSIGELGDIRAESAAPDTELLRDEACAVIKTLVNELPELQREVLLLQVADGLTIREIAVAIGKSTAATNSLLARARETLKRTGSHYFGGETNE